MIEFLSEFCCNSFFKSIVLFSSYNIKNPHVNINSGKGSKYVLYNVICNEKSTWAEMVPTPPEVGGNCSSFGKC